MATVRSVSGRQVGQDTVLARIIRMVRDAQGSKAPVQRTRRPDRRRFRSRHHRPRRADLRRRGCFSRRRRASPAGLLALVTVLIIACPCALGWLRPRPSWSGSARAPDRASSSRTLRAWRWPGRSTPWCWTRPERSPKAVRRSWTLRGPKGRRRRGGFCSASKNARGIRFRRPSSNRSAGSGTFP